MPSQQKMRKEIKRLFKNELSLEKDFFVREWRLKGMEVEEYRDRWFSRINTKNQ